MDAYDLPKYKFGVIDKNNDNEGVRTSIEMNAKREENKSQEPKNTVSSESEGMLWEVEALWYSFIQ